MSNRFRIAELAKRTNTSKETIHYYLRIGLLKKPEKTSKNMAYYNASHVEQLILIRKLRTENYLPLSVIKKMMRDGEILVAESRINLAEELLYKPQSSNQGGGKKPVASHGHATSLSPERLKRYENAGLLLPSTRSGEPTYGWEDIRIAELLNSAESEMPEEAYDFVVSKNYDTFEIINKCLSCAESLEIESPEQVVNNEDSGNFSLSAEQISIISNYFSRNLATFNKDEADSFRDIAIKISHGEAHLKDALLLMEIALRHQPNSLVIKNYVNRWKRQAG